MLKSRSVKIHLVRGVMGFGFLILALVYGREWGWWTLIPALAAAACFGGCPMCWIVGLVNTVLGGERVSLCLDGKCPVEGKAGEQRDQEPTTSKAF
jgi:hypothetical protein